MGHTWGALEKDTCHALAVTPGPLPMQQDRSPIGLLNFSCMGFEYRPIAAGRSNL